MNTTVGDVTKTKVLNDESHKLALEFTVEDRKGTITLAGDLVASNIVNGYINGEAIAAVTFATNHDTTMDALLAAVLALTAVDTATLTDSSNNRQITFVPVNQEAAISMLAWAVTAGAGQVAITVAEANAQVYEGQFVKLDGNGELVTPIVSGEEENQVVGFVINRDGAFGGEEVTIKVRGFAVIFMESSQDSLVAGPIKFGAFNATTELQEVTQLGASDEKLHIGWALDDGDDGDIVRVLVK